MSVLAGITIGDQGLADSGDAKHEFWDFLVDSRVKEDADGGARPKPHPLAGEVVRMARKRVHGNSVCGALPTPEAVEAGEGADARMLN